MGEGNIQLRGAVSMNRDHTRRSVETQGQPSLKQAFNPMQDFMLHKGLNTADSLNEDDLTEFLGGTEDWGEHAECLNEMNKKMSKAKNKSKTTTAGTKGKDSAEKKISDDEEASSVTTIYRKAVRQIDEKSFEEGRWNISSSLEEPADTSDDSINIQ